MFAVATTEPEYYLSIWRGKERLRRMCGLSDSLSGENTVVNMEFIGRYLVIGKLRGELEIYNVSLKDPRDMCMNVLLKNPTQYQILEERYRQRTSQEISSIGRPGQANCIAAMGRKLFQLDESTLVHQLDRQVSHFKVSKNQEWLAVSVS